MINASRVPSFPPISKLEAILVAISMVLCDFRLPCFQIIAIPICDLGISGKKKEHKDLTS